MKVARIEIGWDFLLRVLHGHDLCKVVTDVPDDARVLAVDIDGPRRIAWLTVESATFADVPEGHAMPQFHPTMVMSITETSALADIVSKRHDAWEAQEKEVCPDCGEHQDYHLCPT